MSNLNPQFLRSVYGTLFSGKNCSVGLATALPKNPESLSAWESLEIKNAAGYNRQQVSLTLSEAEGTIESPPVEFRNTGQSVLHDRWPKAEYVFVVRENEILGWSELRGTRQLLPEDVLEIPAIILRWI
jgi:hypothetical protein